ncbi:MAG: soluble lytic murein transglycosylase, partial [Yoonia sp.]
MQFAALLMALVLTGQPVIAQTVNPKSIAAIVAADTHWDEAYAIANDLDPLTVDVLTWLRLRAG